MRKTISKEKRKIVFDIFNGHCAYCGIELKFKGFHVDHIHPVCRSHFEPDLDHNRIQNLFPACHKCNFFKAAFLMEDFRRELQLQVTRLKRQPQFMRALIFSQIEITEKPIVFYFETFKGAL